MQNMAVFWASVYPQVIIAMVGLFIAGYFAKKKQAAKRFKELKRLQAEAKEQGRIEAEQKLREEKRNNPGQVTQDHNPGKTDS